MSDIDKQLTQVLDGYKAAVHAKDADKFIRLYDPAVRVFDAWGLWSYEGAEAWKQAVDAWFSSLGPEKVAVTFDEVKSAGSAQLASVSAIVTYAGISASGERLREMQNRITWVLKTSGHVLRILHEHTSAPIGFDDMKAILQKKRAA